MSIRFTKHKTVNSRNTPFFNIRVFICMLNVFQNLLSPYTLNRNFEDFRMSVSIVVICNKKRVKV